MSQIVRTRESRFSPHAVRALRQVVTYGVFGIHWPGDGDEHLGEVGIDSPEKPLVGIGERGTCDFAAESQMK